MLKETLIGIAIMAVCWLLFVLYIGFQKLCDESSKRGEIARLISKIGSGSLLTYITSASNRLKAIVITTYSSLIIATLI